ncbi:MAG: HAMP domain-containing histidine kinase [Clostridia bacterium]|nr:HAMP domain-containing histidine kinase [Clostridia bacterium]
MKIKDTYGKVATERKSKQLLALSIIAPTILLIFLTLVTIYVTKGVFTTKQNRQLDVIGEAVAACAFLDDKTGVAQAVSSCKVFYYDNTGRVVNGDDTEGMFAETYSAALNNTQEKLGGLIYKIKADTMKGNGHGLYYYIVYLDITQDNKTISTTIWTSIGALAIAIVVLVAVTYVLVMLQMRTYENSINRNNQLVSDISHEFNTPLAIIKSSMQQVLAAPESKIEDESDSLVAVTHEAGRLSRMVKDMLVLSRSDNQRLIIEKSNCDISAIVKEVVEPFQMMCELDGKTMDIDIEEGIKSRTDEDKLRQAIIILLDNATKYTREGEGVSVSLYTTFSKFIVEVADTGDGVDPSELQNIFERFYRVDKSRTSETGGSGLGLSIVKAIMIALKGKVYASINDPKGLRVVLEFPREKFTQNLQK